MTMRAVAGGRFTRRMRAVIPGGGAPPVAPVLSLPSMASLTAVGGVPTVTTDTGNGTLYYAVLTDGGSATDAQIKAGAGGNIVAGKAGNQAVSGIGVQTFAAVTGLADQTAYEIVFLQTSGAAVDSAQSTAGFSTWTGMALMGGACPTISTIASGRFLPPGGTDGFTTTEASTQVNALEAATFTALGFGVLSGNSGTATIRFRDSSGAGGNGNQTASVTGSPGTGEDTTHNDALTAGDLISLAYTDTGTDSTLTWWKMNVAVASQHGNYHVNGNIAGIVCDLPSTTTFFRLFGSPASDGATVEANTQWKNRGYDMITSFQVRLSANDRVNDSTFKLRLNGADVVGSDIVFTGGVPGQSGLKTVTLSQAISSGDLINASLTLGSGVEDLSLCHIAVTMTSSTGNSETMAASGPGFTRTASSTASYLPIVGATSSISAFTEAQAAIKVGFAATVKNARMYLSANTYTNAVGAGVVTVMKNGVATGLTFAIPTNGGAGWLEDANAAHNVTINNTDVLSFELDEGTAGSINIQMWGLTFSQL